MSFSSSNLSVESLLPPTLIPSLPPTHYSSPQHTYNLPMTMTSNPLPTNPDDDDPSSVNPVLPSSFQNIDPQVNQITPSTPTTPQQQIQSTMRRQKSSKRNTTPRASSSVPIVSENQSAISGHAATPEQKRNHHNKHTRRCRKRLNDRYDALHAMLPISQGAEGRHKVQILDHTIQALSVLRDENRLLELRNALRSPPRILTWVESFVPNAVDMRSALDPLISFISQSGHWPYAEVWQLIPSNNNNVSFIQMQHYHIQSTQMLEPALRCLGSFTRDQCGPLQTMNDFVGSVFETNQAIWSNHCVEQSSNTTRAQYMTDACIRAGFAVPIPVSGVLSYVIAFFDVQPRVRDVVHEKFTKFAAVCVGNSYGASRDGHEMEIETEAEETEDVGEEEDDDDDEDGTTT